MTDFLRTVFGATGRQAAGRPAEMRIGDSIVVTDTGFEYLTNYPRQLLVTES
jgi:hypothetical protein